MHAVRRELVKTQAERVRTPLWEIELPWPCSNAIYEEQIRTLIGRALAENITAVAFGDLFLADIRAYRESQLRGTGIEPLFPLWRIPTDHLAREMITGGLRAKITCVDPSKLDRAFAARDFDRQFIDSLPSDVDPCGENGEFHTFAYDSPDFSHRIEVEPGEIITRDGFVFADLVGKSN